MLPEDSDKCECGSDEPSQVMCNLCLNELEAKAYDAGFETALANMPDVNELTDEASKRGRDSMLEDILKLIKVSYWKCPACTEEIGDKRTKEGRCPVCGEPKGKRCGTCFYFEKNQGGVDCTFSLGSALELTSRLTEDSGKDCDGWKPKEPE